MAIPHPSMPAARPNRLATLAVCACLVAAVAAVFGRTVGHEFVNYDDDAYVSENPRISAGLSGTAVAGAFTQSHAYNWHPLTTLSHMLDCQLYGLWAGGHHLTNVLLHAAVAVLLFLVFQRMTGALWPSAFMAAVFAVHPLRVESVAWIAERKDLLSGLFFVLILGAYVRYVARCYSWLRYATLIAVYALGLLTKPMLVTLPLVLLLLDYWPLGRFRAREETLTNGSRHTPCAVGDVRHTACADYLVGPLLREKIPLFVLAAASCLVTLLVQREALESIQRFSLPIRIGNALVAYAAYLRQFFWPTGLAVLYPHPGQRLSLWAVGGAALLLAALSTAAWITRRRHPYLIVGWLWYLIMLVPVIGLIQVGEQSHADRYTYLPQIGLCLALTWAAADRLPRGAYGRWIARAGAGLVIATLMVLAVRQTAYWRDSETLWRHALECESRIVQAHNQLGIVLCKKGQLDPAIEQFQMALQIEPGYAKAHNNLGFVWEKKGQFAEALACYQRAVQNKPGFAQAQFAVSRLLLRAGRLEEALAYAQVAAALKPDDAELYNHQGIILRKLERWPDSIACYRKAIQLKPDYDEAYNNLANALSHTGQVQEATASYRRALQINPRLAAVHYNFGTLLWQTGHAEEAIAQFQQSLAIDPDLAAARSSLDQAQRRLKSP